jgi:hypothetical protein
MENLCRSIAAVGAAGAATAFLLLLIALAGGSQEPFQLTGSVEGYAALLQARAGWLRVSFTFDTIFIVLYVSYFLLLSAALKTEANAGLLQAASGGMILTGLLDAAENAHILAMLGHVEKGLPLQLPEIEWQMVASQVKFLSSYLALFLLGLVFPKTTGLEKLTAWSLLLVQLPVGALIFTAPRSWAVPLVLCRAMFFIFGFLLPAMIYWGKARALVKMSAAR